MKEFEEALTSQGKHPSIPEEDNWFGPLVGTWDMEWIDGHGTEQERHVPGEWIFSWVLEGTAIQDIFICPSRQAQEDENVAGCGLRNNHQDLPPRKTRVGHLLRNRRGSRTT